MLSGKGNEKGERTTMGLISKKATLHVQRTLLYIFLPLICTTTIWNFQKLPSYTFYGGNVVRVLAVPDTDLDIREWGQSSRPLEKGDGGGGWVRSPKISENFFRPFGPQFGLKIKANPGLPGPFPGSVTFLLFFFFHCRSLVPLVAESISHFLTAATKFSCCSSNRKTTLSPTFSLSLSFSFPIFQIRGHDNQ